MGKFIRLACAPVLFLAASSMWGQATESSAARERFPLVFDVSPVLWGLDLGVGYRGASIFPGLDTILWVYGGGAWENQTYERLPDGTLISGEPLAAVDPGTDPFYDRWSARWQLGMEQGMLWNPRVERNRLAVFLFYRGRVDSNTRSTTNPDQLLFLASLPDSNGIFQNAVLAGIKYDDLLLDKDHKTWNGISSELSVEWGPRFFLNDILGDSDYLRFNLTARGFLPILDAAPDRDLNLFSVYICDFISVDYATGSYVPLNIRQSFGGLDPRTGLGDALRGVDTGSLDVNLKAVNNFEIRANLPALWLRDIVPGVLLYWDAGAYSQVGETVPSPQSGFVTSAGAGVFLDVLDLTSLTAYINYRITGVNGDGGKWTFKFDFAAKF